MRGIFGVSLNVRAKAADDSLCNKRLQVLDRCGNVVGVGMDSLFGRRCDIFAAGLLRDVPGVVDLWTDEGFRLSL